MPPKAYTIQQFISAYQISRTSLYRLWKQNLGPSTLRVGRKVLISVDGAEAWAKHMENRTAHNKEISISN